MFNKKFLFTLIICSNIAFGTNSYAQAMIEDKGNTRNLNVSPSQIYSDPKFGFTVEYPSNWSIQTRKDIDGQFGEILTFKASGKEESDELDHSSIHTIALGFHTTEKKQSQSLRQYTDDYLRSSGADSPETKLIFFEETPNRNQFLISSKGHVFRMAQIVIGNLVWFIWSSQNENSNFEMMLNSFKPNKNTPQSLKEAYRQVPQIIIGTSPLAKNSNSDLWSRLSGNDPSGFRLPFSGYTLIPQGPGCNTTHQGYSSEAIDYGLYYQPIKSPYYGSVNFMGWSPLGFGNLLILQHNSGQYYSYLAHLNAFIVSYVNQPVSIGQTVAISGNTGNSSGPHLHYEVKNGGGGSYYVSSAWIRTLPTTTWYSGNANTPCSPGAYDGNATGPN